MTGFGDIGSEEETKLRRVQTSIEDMAEGHFDYSGRRANIFGVPHVTVVNGAIKPEGEPSAPWTGLDDALKGLYGVARELRSKIDGPAYLFWRVPPTIEREGAKTQLYCRLSFAARSPI